MEQIHASRNSYKKLLDAKEPSVGSGERHFTINEKGSLELIEERNRPSGKTKLVAKLTKLPPLNQLGRVKKAGRKVTDWTEGNKRENRNHEAILIGFRAELQESYKNKYIVNKAMEESGRNEWILLTEFRARKAYRVADQLRHNERAITRYFKSAAPFSGAAKSWQPVLKLLTRHLCRQWPDYHERELTPVELESTARLVLNFYNELGGAPGMLAELRPLLEDANKCVYERMDQARDLMVAKRVERWLDPIDPMMSILCQVANKRLEAEELRQLSARFAAEVCANWKTLAQGIAGGQHVGNFLDELQPWLRDSLRVTIDEYLKTARQGSPGSA